MKRKINKNFKKIKKNSYRGERQRAVSGNTIDHMSIEAGSPLLRVRALNNVTFINTFTLRVTVESIVCYSHTFENNLGIKGNLKKYLKESCWLASDQHFLFKCFPEDVFGGKIIQKLSGLFWLL